MTKIEVIGLVVSLLGFILFAIVFTMLYRSFTKSYINDIKDLKEDKNILDDLIKYNHPSHKKRRKIIKVIKGVVFYGLIILLVPFFVLSLVSRARGDILSFNGKGYLLVGSGSMSQRNNTYLADNNLYNQFNTGDIIEIKRVKTADDLKLYDVISFKNNKGINIIHRIIKINEDGSYVTRGDSNLSSDEYNPKFSDIYGVYTNNRIQKVGYMLMFFKSNFGIMTVIALVYCIFMFDYFSKKSNERYDKRLNEINKMVTDKNLKFEDLYFQLENNEIDYELILGHHLYSNDDLIEKSDEDKKIEPEVDDSIDSNINNNEDDNKSEEED